MEDNKNKNNIKSNRNNWKQDPETVKANILEVATDEIANHGLAGSRINVIAEKSDTSKRMIYYYFGSKEALYEAVLEETYKSIRQEEKDLKLDHLTPIEALKTLVEVTIRHHNKHPNFIRLIMNENFRECRYLEKSKNIKELNAPAIERITEIYNRGVESGHFREGVDPLELHWYISALSFFKVSNRSSFKTAFNFDTADKVTEIVLTNNIKEMILRFVLK